jgi:hypothetical protein
MPTTAKMMWKASDMAICERAAKRSVTSLYPSRPGRFRLDEGDRGSADHQHRRRRGHWAAAPGSISTGAERAPVLDDLWDSFTARATAPC